MLAIQLLTFRENDEGVFLVIVMILSHFPLLSLEIETISLLLIRQHIT